MGEADKQRARAAKAAKKAGRKAAAKVLLPKGRRPQPDTGPRSQPCNKALACREHGAHRYRSGNQQMHCNGYTKPETK